MARFLTSCPIALAALISGCGLTEEERAERHKVTVELIMLATFNPSDLEAVSAERATLTSTPIGKDVVQCLRKISRAQGEAFTEYTKIQDSVDLQIQSAGGSRKSIGSSNHLLMAGIGAASAALSDSPLRASDDYQWVQLYWSNPFAGHLHSPMQPMVRAEADGLVRAICF